MIFENRVDIEEKLAGKLLEFKGEDVVVLGIPMGEATWGSSRRYRKGGSKHRGLFFATGEY